MSKGLETRDRLATMRAVDERLARWRFTPYPRLANGHVQTIAAHFWRRAYSPVLASAEARRIDVEPGSQVVAECSWLEDRASRPTLLLVHGLEGDSRSRYMLGTASKALEAGWNAVRLNVRN